MNTYPVKGTTPMTGMTQTDPAWRTPRRSMNGGNCVEVGTAGLAVAVRDSNDPDGPSLAFAQDEWKAFAERVKAGV